MTGIHLRAKVFPMAFIVYLFAPRVSINGSAPVKAKWGDNPMPLAPGRYEISCWFNYLFGPANRARIVVDVQPGATVTITYRTRWLVFLPGKIAVEGTAPAAAVPAGWHPDPSRRYEFRYWNGHAWTEHVSTQSVTAVDPLS